MPIHVTLYIFCLLQGEIGAATTVGEWRDILTGQIYPGFPFAVWSPQGVGKESEIRVVPPVSER